MVNEVILEYLRKYRGQYPIASLREKILSKGYSVSEFNEANSALPPKESSAPAIEKASSKKGGFMWVRFAAFFGIFILVVSIISFLIQLFFNEKFSEIVAGNNVLGIFLLVFYGLVFLMGLFYLYGFVRVGGYTGVKSLKVASWSLIISSMVIVILSVTSVFAVQFMVNGLQSDLLESSSKMFEQEVLGGSLMTGNVVSSGFSGAPWWVYTLFISFLVLGLFFLVMRYIFSISLIRIRSQVKFSLVAGILGLIVSIFLTLYLFYIGYLMTNPLAIFSLMFNPLGLSILYWSAVAFGILGLVSLLFEVMTLFSASKKYEL